MGHPIIMGRKTHESIGRVLPGRKNIIITRQKNFRVPDAFIAVTKESALKHCEGAEQAFVIGGADIYRLFLPHTDRIYLTQIHETYPDADTYFPEIVAETFKEAQRDSSHLTNPDRNRENADTAGPPPRYSYITLERT
jgi:dihydrofolate reductase